MITRRGLFKLHQAVGLAAALFLLIVALTGAALVFRGSFKPGPPPAAPVVERPLALELLMARAVAAGPGDPVTDITLPDAPDRPYEFWLDDDAETVVFLAGDGALLGSRTTRGGVMQTLFRLHTGEIAGTPGEALSFLGGVSVVAGQIQAETPGFSVFLAGTALPAKVATGQKYPRGLTANATHVYWSNFGHTGMPLSGSSSRIMRAALGAVSSTSIGAPEIFADGQMDARHLAIDATNSYLYWINGGSGPGKNDAGVMRMPLTGGTPTRLIAATYPVDLALDSTYYFRIDSVNEFGTTTGDVRSFSTWAAADVLLDESGNPITDENGEYIETID